jgi:integrase
MKPYRIERAENGKEYFIIIDRNGREHSGLIRTGEFWRPPIFKEIYGQEQVVGEGPEEEIIEIRWPKVPGIRPHIRGKGNGRYWTGRWVYERQVSGKTITTYWNTYIEAAEAKKGTEEAEVEYGEELALRAKRGLTVANAVSTYLEDCREVDKMVEGTLVYKRRILGEFVQAFPRKKLAKVTISEIKDFLDSKVEDGKPSRYNRFRRELSALYSYAMIKWDDKILRNPLRKIKPQRVGKSRDSYVPTNTELQQVIEYAYSIRARNSQPYNLLVAYQDTWARKREVLNWTWKRHIDWKRFDGVGGVLLVSRKSQKFNRVWLPMSADLRKALKNQQRKNYGTKWVFEVRANAMKGRKNRYGENAFGGRITDANAMIRDLCKAARLPKSQWFNFHAIRKNRITDALNRGKPVHKVRDFARHHNISVTNEYAKATTDDLLDMVG